MNEKPKITDTNMAPQIDPVLKLWYQQKSEGVQVNERVELNETQRKHVEIDAMSTQEAERIFGNELGRKGPAVSMIDLEKSTRNPDSL